MALLSRGTVLYCGHLPAGHITQCIWHARLACYYIHTYCSLGSGHYHKMGRKNECVDFQDNNNKNTEESFISLQFVSWHFPMNNIIHHEKTHRFVKHLWSVDPWKFVYNLYSWKCFITQWKQNRKICQNVTSIEY